MAKLPEILKKTVIARSRFLCRHASVASCSTVLALPRRLNRNAASDPLIRQYFGSRGLPQCLRLIAIDSSSRFASDDPTVLLSECSRYVDNTWSIK